MSLPFDAVLMIAFGGPQGPDDIRPFLQNVLRGRRVAPGRVDEVAHHYELFGGLSPLTELTMRQAAGLRGRLEVASMPLPVFVGMRNWHPFLADTLAEMSRAGIRRAIGFIAAAHRSYSGCLQYRENVGAARRHLKEQGLADVRVTYVPDWHTHPQFIAANADNVLAAVRRLPPELHAGARLVFTAHSIPATMAERYPYRQQFEKTARLVADAVVADAPELMSALPYATVYQSRSGRPEDPWLEPDIIDYLHAERERGLEAAIIAPIGFVADHVEVLYDLDVEAAGVCREIGLPMVRAAAVNDHSAFLDMMADVVQALCRRYRAGRAMEILPAEA